MQNEQTQIREVLSTWRDHPDIFAKQAFNFYPSNQQEQAFKELGKLVCAKRKVDEGEKLTEEETRYATKRGVSIMAGKGPGKDAFAAIIAFWFHLLFESKVYLVAPSLDNLKSNLLAEMSLWKSRRNPDGSPACVIADCYDLRATSCVLKSDPDKGKHWFIRTATAGPHSPSHEQEIVLAGKHARYMMFIIDEASGVPDAVFRPLDTTLTDPVNFVILLFNPTRRSGFAINTHMGDESKYWIPLHWNAEDSNLITPDQINYLKQKYGEQSVEYRVSVRGLPPEADPDAVIPYEWCMNSAEQERMDEQALESYPTIIGVDVARHGNDKSAIVVRQGPQILQIDEYSHVDTVQLAHWVMAVSADYSPSAILIDTAGMGVGVYDHLRHVGCPHLIPVNVGKSAFDSTKFVRLRDELWFRVRKVFEAGNLRIPNNPRLFAELSSPKYETLDNGKIKVETKRSMKKRKLPSPNQADALILTYYQDYSPVHALSQEDMDDDPDYRGKRKTTRRPHSWMEV